MGKIHIYTITVQGDCMKQAVSDGRYGRYANLDGTATDVDIWAYTKEKAIEIAERYGKVLYCYVKE